MPLFFWWLKSNSDDLIDAHLLRSESQYCGCDKTLANEVMNEHQWKTSIGLFMLLSSIPTAAGEKKLNCENKGDGTKQSAGTPSNLANTVISYCAQLHRASKTNTITKAGYVVLLILFLCFLTSDQI